MAGTGSTIGCVRAGFGVTGNQELRWERTKDLLYTYSVPVPPNLYSSTFANVGTIDNSGIELTIASTPVTTRNFRWDLGATVSHNRNELVRFSNDQYEMVEIKTGYFADDLKMYTMRIVEGEPLGNFWGPKFLGFDAAGGAVYEDLDGASLRFVGEYPETCRKDVALRTFLLGLCDSSAAFLDFSRRGRFQCVEHPACGGRGALRHVRGFSRRSGIGAGSGRIDQLFRCGQRRSAVHFPWRGLIAAAIVMNGLAYNGPDRKTETCGERASDLGRGGHDHGLFLPVCRFFDGPRQFHGPRSRKDDSLHSPFPCHTFRRHPEKRKALRIPIRKAFRFVTLLSVAFRSETGFGPASCLLYVSICCDVSSFLFCSQIIRF